MRAKTAHILFADNSRKTKTVIINIIEDAATLSFFWMEDWSDWFFVNALFDDHILIVVYN